MANLQYIGARYVPKFYLNPDYPAPDNRNNDWKSGVDYEALTIVTYNNDSYTSKKPVPDTVGDPASNPEYWVCTTKYTAALMALQSAVGYIENFIGDPPLDTNAQELAAGINEIVGRINEYMTPDDFSGDDSDKIQAACDALANVGGVIVINREYVLKRNIKISHRTDVSNKKIYFVGLGKNALLDFDLYSFEGVDTNYRDYGGLVFIGVNCTGLRTAFITENLVRLNFIACSFEKFEHVVAGTDNDVNDSMQSNYFESCTIRQCTDYAIYARHNLWDLHVHNCVIERNAGVLSAQSAKGVFIDGNCIEESTVNQAQIVFHGEYNGLSITNNYFESNHINIDLFSCTNNATDTAYITANKFNEVGIAGITKGVILPKSVNSGSFILSANNMNPKSGTCYLISIDESGHSHTHVSLIGNDGQLNDPDNELTDEIDNNADIAMTAGDTNITLGALQATRRGRTCQLSARFAVVNTDYTAGDTIFTLDDVNNYPIKSTFFEARRYNGGSYNITDHFVGILKTDGTISIFNNIPNSGSFTIEFNIVWIA